MSENNIFEIASRNKYRFNYKGSITTEDLWDLPVTALDSIFKELKAKEKQASEESLLDTRTKEDVETEVKIAIIRHIVRAKQLEQENRKSAKVRAEQKKKIADALAAKRDRALYEKSEEELLAMLAEIG